MKALFHLPEGIKVARLIRSDKIDMVVMPSGKWIVRCTHTRTSRWFWSPSSSNWWVSASELSIQDISQLCEMPFDQALNVLQTCPEV